MESNTSRPVTERHSWEPGGWKVAVTETSTGVYEITAVSARLGTIGVTTDEPESALDQVRREAEARSQEARA